MGARSERIHAIFNGLDKNTMDLLPGFYHERAVFIDPLGRKVGLLKIRQYYEHLYENVDSIRFDFTNEVKEGDTHTVVWTMHLRAPKLNGGEEFSLDGNSVIRFDPETNKVIYHRDYYDMGEFIYERIPLLKLIIGYIKSRLEN